MFVPDADIKQVIKQHPEKNADVTFQHDPGDLI